MKKHAYLIMAHSQFRQVAKLVRLIDDEDNDIYLHIDKKVSDAHIIFNDIIKPAVNKSHIYFVPQNNVNWGAYSLVKTEIDLLKASLPKEYQYYHLLSGADLPLKSQKYIHRFFSENQGKEFVQLGTKEYIERIQQRVRYYWIFQEKLGTGRQNVIYKVLNRLRYGVVLLQSFFKVDRRKNNEDEFKCYYAGAQWFSITHDFAKYVVSKEKEIEKVFYQTLCCDEVFLQTILMNSRFKDSIYHKEFDGSSMAIMRKIDWERGGPYVWTEKDFNELINSDCLFARKFDEKLDSKIIELLYERILLEGKNCEE